MRLQSGNVVENAKTWSSPRAHDDDDEEEEGGGRRSSGRLHSLPGKPVELQNNGRIIPLCFFLFLSFYRPPRPLSMYSKRCGAEIITLLQFCSRDFVCFYLSEIYYFALQKNTVQHKLFYLYVHTCDYNITLKKKKLTRVHILLRFIYIFFHGRALPVNVSEKLYCNVIMFSSW